MLTIYLAELIFSIDYPPLFLHLGIERAAAAARGLRIGIAAYLRTNDEYKALNSVLQDAR